MHRKKPTRKMRVGAIGGKEARINLNNIKVIKRENSFSAQKNRSKETSLLRFGTDVHNDTLANPHEIKVFGSRRIYFTEKI